MRDARVAQLAGSQFNRVSRRQLAEIGLSDRAIEHRVTAGRLVIVEQGVFAVAPVLDDDWGRWMGATLTAPGTRLSHASAATARGFWSSAREFETVTRPGRGGPRRHGGVLVFRSSALDGNSDVLRGIPITSAERTVQDLAAHVSTRALARAVREAVRLRQTTVSKLVDQVGKDPGRRGSRRLSAALARYTGLPLERARSGAEVRALEALRDAGVPMPRLNANVAGGEADLSWARLRLIIEVDGGPFHLDIGADADKQARWEAAGWRVLRLPSHVVYEQPERLIALAPRSNVPRSPL
jgi:hypothetical protein